MMDMEQGLLYLLAGYLSGSVLYARVFFRLAAARRCYGKKP